MQLISIINNTVNKVRVEKETIIASPLVFGSGGRDYDSVQRDFYRTMPIIIVGNAKILKSGKSAKRERTKRMRQKSRLRRLVVNSRFRQCR
jgi:hypothetical protein